MQASAVLTALRSRGARVRIIEGNRLGVEPRRVLTPELRAACRAHRSAIVELLGLESFPPFDRLDRAWQEAVQRALGGFASAGKRASLEDLAGAARLELVFDRRVEPAYARTSVRAARQLLPAVYRGEVVSRVGADGLAHVGLSVDALDLDPRPRSEPEPPPGKMFCRGCLELTPEHPGSYCFACATGTEDSLPSRFAPIALELLERFGPARVRGSRIAEIHELAKERDLLRAVTRSLEPPAARRRVRGSAGRPVESTD